jgi:hypothetical protein
MKLLTDARIAKERVERKKIRFGFVIIEALDG